MTPAGGTMAPRWARVFVGAFLVAFAVCGVFGIESWPLTGWRLFSNLRTDEQTAWRAVAVDSEGSEEQIRFAHLPKAYRNFVLVMRDFPSRTPAEQERLCDTWADVLRRRGEDVAVVRIYRIDWRLSERRSGGRGSPPRRTLRYTCAERAA